MSDPMKNCISVEELAEALRAGGYRAAIAAQNGRPVIQSAAQGLGFVVVPGNPASDKSAGFVDFTFNCLIRIEGELKNGLVEQWNRAARFARLYREGSLLVLAMDVVIAGGVSGRHLQAHCELWDRLMHDFIAHVRLQGASQTADRAAA